MTHACWAFVLARLPGVEMSARGKPGAGLSVRAVDPAARVGMQVKPVFARRQVRQPRHQHEPLLGVDRADRADLLANPLGGERVHLDGNIGSPRGQRDRSDERCAQHV